MRSSGAKDEAGGTNALGAATRAAYDAVRRLILDGTLGPGTEIAQLELGRRVQMGRTPLREALRLLERDGLVVDTGPHRPVRISSLSMTDLDDLYSMRVLGEGLAVWVTVPTLRAEDFDQLARDVKRIAKEDADAHARFHAVLRSGASERLAAHLETLWHHAERYQRAYLERDPRVLEEKVAEHTRILEACRARDRDLARALLVDHVAGTATALMTAERHAPFMLPAAVEMAKAGHGAHALA